ncbi:MAG TPA: site-specific integrase, partial [Armatimonadota bacterium]|nr:site-specific integrase [Armatimonadota bacterium]
MKGYMRQRSPGSWSCWIDLGRDTAGNRKRATFTVRGGKREAQRALNEALAKVAAGEWTETTKRTVGEFLAEWLGHARATLAPKTWHTYQDFVTDHLTPALGAIPLAKLSPLHIQHYYRQALESGRKDGQGGLSPQTVLHHHHALRKALEQAVRWELLRRNPADGVDPPRVPRRERPALTAEQMETLLRGAHGSWLYLPIVLALGTGLRRGEILGLRWSDLDLYLGRLTVRQSLTLTGGGETLFKEPKNRKSRPVSLPAFLVELLEEAQREQAALRETAGAAWQETGLVITQADGRERNPNNLSQAFLKLRRRLDATLPDGFTFHDLRHSHSTLLILQGVHAKI